MRLFFIFSILLFALIGPPAHAQYTPNSLFVAARSGDMARVQAFLDEGLNQESINNALGAATVGQQLEIMDLLLEHGANPNHMSSWNTSLLNSAIMLEFYDAARKLIDAGANPNVYGYKRRERTFTIDWQWTPLMCAAFRGNIDLVRQLLKNGADPALKGWSTSSNDIETAADIAAYSGHTDILKLLIKKDAALHPHTIYKVVRGGHLDTLKYLLKKRPGLNQVGPLDKTLLMEASWWGHIDLIDELVRRGADVNFQTARGSTALIEAVSNPDRNLKHQLDVVKTLIQHGADTRLTRDNLKAIDIARQNNKKNIVEYLHNLNDL